MFKKCVVLSAVFALTALNAYSNVPIFSSTDSADDYFQQMDLTPTNSYTPVVQTSTSLPFVPSATYTTTETPVAYAAETPVTIARSEFLDFVKISNDNFQNAIQNLEGAEVGIREQLINYKSQYNEVNTRYNVVKSERDALKKQVRAYEKKIKEIERTKKQISKNIVGA